MKKNSKKKGFTLIELIAVIAILGILGAVMVPNIKGYMTRAKRANVVASSKVIVNAVEAYNSDAETPLIDTQTATDAMSAIQTATGDAAFTVDGDSTIPGGATLTILRGIANGTTAEKDIKLDGKKLDIK